jgi:hypothetical protein
VGFCATVSGASSAIAMARKTKMRMRWLIDRSREEGSEVQNPRTYVSSSQDSKTQTRKLEKRQAWILQCIDALWWDNSERFSAIQEMQYVEVGFVRDDCVKLRLEHSALLELLNGNTA